MVLEICNKTIVIYEFNYFIDVDTSFNEVSLCVSKEDLNTIIEYFKSDPNSFTIITDDEIYTFNNYTINEFYDNDNSELATVRLVR